MSDTSSKPAETNQPAELPAAAKRALAEAEARRRTQEDSSLPRELGGRDGPEPVR